MRTGPILKIEENIPLGPLTTLKVGGPARFFVEVRSVQQVFSAVEFAYSRKQDMFVLSGGSNILVSDNGFDGLVMKIGLTGISTSDESEIINAEPYDRARPYPEDLVTLTAQAGEDWDGFAEFCVGKNLAGVECLSGIPGSVGATPVQNVGAYGQDVSETIQRVTCLDLETNEIVELSNEACGFAYRTSVLNSSLRGRYVVLSVTFRLRSGGPPTIVYKDLQDAFSGREPSLRDVRDEVIRIRAAKSMVIDKADPNFRSAGSFFKNPVVPVTTLDHVSKIAEVDVAPHFPAGDGKVKIPAAWLIEQSGFHKGFRLGNAGISTNHSLALINRGGATASEIIALKDMITNAVHAKFGISLTPEPVMVGF